MSTNLPGKLVVRCFSVSADGYGAGPNQDIDNPMGVGGMALHEWVFPTRTLQKTLLGKDGGITGPDDDFAARGFEDIGSWILGRNMFGPVRGPWPDETWKGWWGDEPPYHCQVFVLTHHARAPIEMKGGTVFISSPMASRRRCSGHARPPAARTSAWAAASRPSGNFCGRAWSTRCISPWRRRCWVRVKICSPTSIW
jgi:dihydrofolate reductase